MWVLIGLEEKSNTIAENQRLNLLPGNWTIGRKKSDVLINDPSLSRQHASIAVELILATDTYRLTLVDSNSKYGTFVNGTKIGQKILKLNDIIKFGLSPIVYRVEWIPYTLCGSHLNQNEKMQLNQSAKDNNMKVSKLLNSSTTHLVMSKILFTSKVLIALAFRIPIVNLEWFKSFRIDQTPNHIDFLPSCTDYPPTLFVPNPKRQDLFSGITFIAFVKNEWDTMNEVVKAAGGSIELYDISKQKDSFSKFISQFSKLVLIESKQLSQDQIHEMKKITTKYTWIPLDNIGKSIVQASLEPLSNLSASQHFQASASFDLGTVKANEDLVDSISATIPPVSVGTKAAKSVIVGKRAPNEVVQVQDTPIKKPKISPKGAVVFATPAVDKNRSEANAIAATPPSNKSSSKDSKVEFSTANRRTNIDDTVNDITSPMSDFGKFNGSTIISNSQVSDSNTQLAEKKLDFDILNIERIETPKKEKQIIREDRLDFLDDILDVVVKETPKSNKPVSNLSTNLRMNHIENHTIDNSLSNEQKPETTDSLMVDAVTEALAFGTPHTQSYSLKHDQAFQDADTPRKDLLDDFMDSLMDFVPIDVNKETQSQVKSIEVAEAKNTLEPTEIEPPIESINDTQNDDVEVITETITTPVEEVTAIEVKRETIQERPLVSFESSMEDGMIIAYESLCRPSIPQVNYKRFKQKTIIPARIIQVVPSTALQAIDDF